MTQRPRDPWTHHMLAIAAVLSVMAAFAALLFVEIPEKNRDAVNLVLGAILGTGFTTVYQFYFGSSQGARENRDQLNKQADRLAEVAATAVTAPAAVGADGSVSLAPGESVRVDAERSLEDPA